MSLVSEMLKFRCGEAAVEVYRDRESLGIAAGRQAACLINGAIESKGLARIIAATGNSQIPLIEALTQQDVHWSAVEVFHMDEYVGLPSDHPASFRRWIHTKIEEPAHPKQVHYLAGDAADLPAEIQRYSKLLREAPIDLAFVGFGENGHIAFNDPHEADFEDPALVRKASLDEACRSQQVGEGHFGSLDAVPRFALTITCTGLLMAESWVCCVPDSRKARAVQCALQGPVSPSCPASLVQRHQNTFVYLDVPSAALLSPLDR